MELVEVQKQGRDENARKIDSTMERWGKMKEKDYPTPDATGVG